MILPCKLQDHMDRIDPPGFAQRSREKEIVAEGAAKDLRQLATSCALSLRHLHPAVNVQWLASCCSADDTGITTLMARSLQ